MILFPIFGAIICAIIGWKIVEKNNIIGEDLVCKIFGAYLGMLIGGFIGNIIAIV